MRSLLNVTAVNNGTQPVADVLPIGECTRQRIGVWIASSPEGMRLLAPVLLAMALSAQSHGPLTDQRVYDLVHAGVAMQEVLRIIAEAPSVDFDLRPVSTDALLKGGVSEQIIKAMAAREERAATSPLNGLTPAQDNGNATRIGENRIGESVQDWLAINSEASDWEAACQAKKRRVEGGISKLNCKQYRNLRDGKLSELDTSDNDRRYTWKFKDGKLAFVQISIPGPFASHSERPDIPKEIQYLIDAYGKPSDIKTIPYQSPHGPLSDLAELSWHMADGTAIVAAEHITDLQDSGPRRELTVLFMSKDMVGKYALELRANPYVP